jgi:hypothetical protein
MLRTDHTNAPSLGTLLFTPGVASGATGSRLSISTVMKSATLTVSLTVAVLLGAGTQPNHENDQESEPDSRIVIAQPSLTLSPSHVSSTSVSVPLREHAARISADLGLGKSDIARIFDISRPTLYSWIKGETEPKEGRQAERVRQLGELVAAVSLPNPAPIYDRFVEYALPGETSSILDYLRQPEWDKATLQRLLTDARRLTDDRSRRLLAQAGTSTRNRGDGRLADNLIDLGNA